MEVVAVVAWEAAEDAWVVVADVAAVAAGDNRRET